MATVSNAGSNSLWNQMQTVRAAQANVQARQQANVDQKKQQQQAATDPMAMAAAAQQGLAGNPGLAGTPANQSPTAAGNDTGMGGGGNPNKGAKPLQTNNLLSAPQSTLAFVQSRNNANAASKPMTVQAPPPPAAAGMATATNTATTNPVTPDPLDLNRDGQVSATECAKGSGGMGKTADTTNRASDTTQPRPFQQKLAEQFNAVSKANLTAANGSLLSVMA